MSSTDAENLRRVAHECRALLRDDIIQALEAGAVEIDRLEEVVKDCHRRIRGLKPR